MALINDLHRLLVPAVPRSFAGQRWLNITLRSFHLVGVVGLGGGFLFDVEESVWGPFWQLTVVTGVALMVLYVWTSALWFVQLKGLVILAKMIMVWIAVASPAWRAELFTLAIVVSGVIAHAPGAVRGHVPFFRGRPAGRC